MLHMSVLAANLQREADGRALDTATLATLARVPATDLARYLDGTAWPCPRVQSRLAVALGVTVADLHREREE